MHHVRQSQTIIRFVLIGFVLSLGVAIASPVVSPKVSDFVCSTSGMVKMVVDGQDSSANNSNLDCPLCASLSGAPLDIPAVFTPPDPLAHSLKPVTVARIATLTAPPLPSRGPPTFPIHH